MLKKPVPKSQRSKRALREREAKLIENVKKSLVLKGAATSKCISDTLTDLYMLKKPDAIRLTRRNATRPFEDQMSVEFLARQNDCSLFAFGSHSKKRPHNLVLGRLFDFQVLDMFEFGVDPETFKSMRDLEGQRKATIHIGSKPCFIFKGEEFDSNPDFVVLKSVLLDYFRGEVMDKVNLQGIDRLIVCTAHEYKVYFRQYAILLKKSGTKFPRVELEEVGPTLDLTFRRRKSAAEEVQKNALRQPKAGFDKPKKVKNVEQGHFGDKAGRVHLEKQDLSTMGLAKMKGLGKRKSALPDGAAAGAAEAKESENGNAEDTAKQALEPSESKKKKKARVESST